MATVTLTPQAILTSLTRIVHPEFGVDVVNLGSIYGIEMDGDRVRITMAHASASEATRAETEQAIQEGLYRRHPELASVQFDISFDPPWREDFITPEGQLQLDNPLPSTPSADLDPEEILESLKFVIDPEVGVNVVDLGLIYDVALHGTAVVITMTLTTPGCPLHDTIEEAIQRVVDTRHPGITEVRTELVWDPPWDTEMISDAGRKALGW